MRYGFTILDVFTSVPFGGNQLAGAARAYLDLTYEYEAAKR